MRVEREGELHSNVGLVADLRPVEPAARPRRTPSGELAVWFIPIGLVAIGMVFFAAFVATGEISHLQCSVALVVTAIPFTIAAAERPKRILHPLSVFGFTLLLGFAGQTVFLTQSSSEGASGLLSGLGDTEVLTEGLLVMSVGIGVMAIGYLAVGTQAVPRPGRFLRRAVERGFSRPSPRRAFWAVVVLCGIAMVAFALYAPKVGIQSPAELLTSRKRYGEIQGGETVFGYYRFAISLAGIAFLIGVFTLVRRRVPLRSGLGAAVLVALLLTAAYATVTSSRTELFATLGAAAFMAIAIRGREPRMRVIVVCIAAALLAVTLLGGLRAVNQGQAGSLSETTGTEALVEDVFGSRTWAAIGPTSVLVDRVPDAYPFQYGKTMFSILWAPVPRTAWPEKPPVRLGPVISPAVFGFDVDRRTGDPPGLVGELWLNGGMIVVVIGMALFGALLRRVERWHRLAPATGGLTAIPYGVLVVALCLRLPVSDVTGVAISIIEELPLLALLVWAVRAPAGEI